jgi:hypothetical protein
MPSRRRRSRARSAVPWIVGIFLVSIVSGASAVSTEEGTLIVSPQQGPIGTRVTLVGRGCADPEPGQNTGLVFQGGGVDGAIIGSDEVTIITADSPDPIRRTFTIPATLGPLMNEGGGRVTPGPYFFRTYPPACFAAFTVTGGLAKTGPSTLILVGLGFGLLAFGIRLRLLSRSV